MLSAAAIAYACAVDCTARQQLADRWQACCKAHAVDFTSTGCSVLAAAVTDTQVFTFSIESFKMAWRHINQLAVSLCFIIPDQHTIIVHTIQHMLLTGAQHMRWQDH